MKKIIVNGGKRLSGEISVSGSKNAALPIIFACILTKGISEIENLPDIGDVKIALSLLKSFGALIEREGNKTMIDTRRLRYVDPDVDLVKKIRASTYLLGACLSRFGRCPVMSFGGCNFSLRPIDMHIDAFMKLGARMDGDALVCDSPHGSVIEFRKASVGATVNAVLLAATADGETVISGCAVEPHIDSLISFLNSCGASITRHDREIRISGRSLHGGSISVIGDMIEAGSYLALSLMTGGDVRILKSPLFDMKASLDAFSSLGAKICFSDGSLYGSIDDGRYFSVTTAPYPGFPTDLQPLLAPLMAHQRGGEITDNVWQTRFGYLSSLSPFGVKSTVNDNRALIFKSEIRNGISSAPDLRGGMAALICALAAEGQSEIYSAETILRGYEGLEEKLCALGADIKIKNL